MRDCSRTCASCSLFSGEIAILKADEIKLHISKNITPVAQRERPIALRKAGIGVGGPTPWLNPLYSGHLRFLGKVSVINRCIDI